MDYLSLSRAARLAGVTRSELQRRIRRGEIATFEGSVAVEDLLRAYPRVSLHDDAALERVQHIKDTALPRTGGTDAVLPSPQVLIGRLRAMGDQLSTRVSALDAAETLLDETGWRLAELANAPEHRLHDLARTTLDWFQSARAALTLSAADTDHARLLAKDAFLRIMAANVKLIPSGRDFFVEGSESILDASVRAGLNLSYGCASGNCGECKSRLVSGEIQKIRDHDYVLSEREKQMGYFLSCSHTAVTDILIEATEALSVHDLPHQEIRASLRKIERLSENLLSLQVQTPRTQTLRFMSGQRVRLTLEDGASKELPVASCPCNGRNLWFYLRRNEDAFSSAAFSGLRPGQMILIQGPIGHFVLAEDAPDPAVFVAIGDGIAPIKSLIEHAVSIDLIESFDLYWDTTDKEGHYLGHWGRALRDSLDNFRFTPLMSGHIEDVMAVIQADHPDLSVQRYYLAGPNDSTGRLGAWLIASGVPEDQVMIEATS